MYKPESLGQLFEHWERSKSIWVPQIKGGAVRLRIRAVIRTESISGLPLHAVVIGRTSNRAPWRWFGVHLGEPPPLCYPIQVLIIKKLPDEAGDLYWHPNRRLREAEGGGDQATV